MLRDVCWTHAQSSSALPLTAPARPRSPGIAFAVLTVVLVALVGLFAFTSRQPPPPTIAEFAPQSVENITDAPTDQSSSSGRGAGPCVNGQACDAGNGEAPIPTTPVQAPIDVPRVRKCVGDPPRQIEDPQSPPCVPYWSGDNGGATYRGVTRDEIRIAVNSNDKDSNTKFATFFNKRFEFYGRHITMVPVKSAGGDPAQQKAMAASADEEGHVFASTTNFDGGGVDYASELARRGIVESQITSQSPEPFLAASAPYMWQYVMGTDRQATELGRWACARLAGKPASHTADPLLLNKPRKFGILVVSDQANIPVPTDKLQQALSGCGQRADPVIKSTAGLDHQQAANAILQMKQAGVTSIFCLCQVVGMATYGRAAEGESYAPEWLVDSFSLVDLDAQIHLWLPASQRTQLFGLTFQPRQIATNDEPSTWALKEVDPTSSNGAGNSLLVYLNNYAYRGLLLLASGLQMAGPYLTPTTFEHGLNATRFPNPEHPNQPGKVGFGAAGIDDPVDHTMTNDGAEWWWDEAGQSPYTDSQGGTICYVAAGTRRAAGTWPTDGDPFFRRPCG